MGGVGPEGPILEWTPQLGREEKRIYLWERLGGLIARREESGETWGLFAQDLRSGEVLFEHRADERFSAASVNKLPIAIFAVAWADAGEASLQDRLELKHHHKRPGTGILRYYPDGWQVTLKEAVLLMLIVSDNTAAKMVVEHFGAQAINFYLREVGLEATQLEVPLDGGFSYGLTTPRETGQLLRGLYKGTYISWERHDIVESGMKTSRFPYGIRRGIEGLPFAISLRQKLSHRYLKALSQAGNKNRLAVYLEGIIKGPWSRLIANKESGLDDIRNEVAIVFAERPYTLAVFSQGLSDRRYSPRNEGVLAIAKVAKLVHQLAQS